MRTATATRSRKAAHITAAVTVSLASLFAGVPVSAADPYDDDSGSSYDAGGSDSGGVVDEPSGGGTPEAPGEVGGAQDDPDESGGGQDAPDQGGATPQPPGEVGGTQDNPDESGGTPGSPDQGGVPEGGAPQEVPAGSGGATQPTELDAPAPDVETATSSSATQVSTSSSSQEVSTYQESLTSTVSTSSTAVTLNSPVSQWNSSWLSYDTYYRPIFTNPYRIPLQVIYDYGGGPQIFTVPPLQRAVVDVPNAGVYSFTAATKPASGPPTNISVGSFSGGGFQPAPGQAPPQKPARLNTTKNVLVQIKFDRGTSEPFRVNALTDLGKDPDAKNTTKVLLDQEIPAWGEWTKTPEGDALFVINETQLLPGVKRPGQDPLPGYNIKLAASQKPTSGTDRHNSVLITVAVVVAVLALGAALLLVVVPRRRRAAKDGEKEHV